MVCGVCVCVCSMGSGEVESGNSGIRYRLRLEWSALFVHSNAYSTATEHASLAVASVPCCLRLCSVSKDASHAGQEWRPREETLDGATDRERFDDCDAYRRNQHQSKIK